VTSTRRAVIRRRLGVLATALLAAMILGLVVLIAIVLGTGDDFAQTRAANQLMVTVAQTDTAAGQALAPLAIKRLTRARPAAGTPVISVNTFHHLQNITGFGAALTDSSASLIERGLSTRASRAVMASLFGSGGLDLNVLRLPMGASDFTAEEKPYSYDDGSPDPSLSRFSIAHDRSDILPALRSALSLDPNLQVLATPWSLPGWMKANGALDNRHDRGTVRVADYQAYADYFVRFLQAYAKAGVAVKAVTLANEPTNPTAYPGMNIPEATEVRLIHRFLAPALRHAGLSRVAILGGDVGWGTRSYLAQLATSVATHDLVGIASHCYYGDPQVMSQIHALNPNLKTEMTECSPGISTVPISEVVIGSLRNWASQVYLWNLALDPQGGPVQPPNHGCPGCTGLVTIDPATGKVSHNIAYDELGQASEFFDPGAQRVASNTFVHEDYRRPGTDYVSPGIDDVAAVNRDGSVALMAYNNSAQPRTFAVEWHSYFFTDTLAPGATVSFRWREST
jgi:glucosylceramidase